MSTPYKAGVNGLLNQKLDNMIHAIRADIRHYFYKDVALKDFIE